MADSKDVDTVSAELESRLDDIFGVSEVAPPGFDQQDTATHYPLAELKNLILSIDWEITDHVLEQLLQQIKDLKLTYQQDKIVMAFLQILHSLGNYIQNNRAKSYPKTFKTLNAVFSSLDNVVLNRDMTETAKKKILRAEMKRYKELKTLIAQGKTAARKKPKAKIDDAETPVISGTAVTAETAEDQAAAATEPTAQPPDTETSEPTLTDQGQEPGVIVLGESEVATLADAVAEIKKYIHDQISALSKEIHALRKR